MPNIDGQRVIADLKRLAEFGRYKTGVHLGRPIRRSMSSRGCGSLSGSREAGLDTVIDGIGNVIGRNPTRRASTTGRLAQRNPALWRLARRGRWGSSTPLSSRGPSRPIPRCAELGLDVAAGPTRRAITGTFSAADLHRALRRRGDRLVTRGRDNGMPLREALERAGFAGQPRESVDPSALHRLFRSAYRAGGHTRQHRFAHRRGRDDRRDLELPGHLAGGAVLCRHDSHGAAAATRVSAMVRLATGFHDRFPEAAGPRTVWTIGRMLLEPNAPFGDSRPRRDAGPVPRRRSRSAGGARKALHKLVRRGRSGRALPVPDRDRSRAPSRGRWTRISGPDRSRRGGHAPGMHMRLPSAAGHDAAVLSYRMPSGMMFIPSLAASATIGRRTARRRTSCSAPRSSRPPPRTSCAWLGDPMSITLQESLRGMFYAPFYAALALGAYSREGYRSISSARLTRPERRTGCSTGQSMSPGAVRCGSCRPMTAGAIAISSVSPRSSPATRSSWSAASRAPTSPSPSFTRGSVATVSEVPTPWLCLQEDLRRACLDPRHLPRITEPNHGRQCRLVAPRRVRCGAAVPAFRRGAYRGRARAISGTPPRPAGRLPIRVL